MSWVSAKSSHGGAQAVAALAYGLDSLAGGQLKKVDKIVGPGNLFVGAG